MTVKKSPAQLDREVAAILRQRPARTRASGKTASSGRVAFRAIGGEGDPWPAWLRAHGTACGVYAIKEGDRIVYVGSSKRRLYDTVTRHFQQWKRKKNWWKGMHGAGHDPGLTYPRGRCQVAIVLVACGAELEEEARWIERMQPRDNLTENPDGETSAERDDEVVPF